MRHAVVFAFECLSYLHEPPSGLVAHPELGFDPWKEIAVPDRGFHREKIASDLDDVFGAAAEAELLGVGWDLGKF